MSKHILKDLPELVEAGIISEEISGRIKSYYLQKAELSPNRLVLVFGILGSLLVGLGVILIIAHNWDDLSRTAKLFFALLPLLLGQAICAFTLFKMPQSRLWREAGSVFLLFAIGASIAIVSQVYNIPGNLSGYLFIWMLLSIPMIYIMQSAMTSLLVIGGITWYACILSYFDYPSEIAWYYWPMLAATLPFFIKLMNGARGNFFHFHRWFLALSVTTTLGMFGHGDGTYLFICYMSLFSLFILLGDIKKLSEERILNNAFLVTGSLGSIILLLVFTMEWPWTEITRSVPAIDEAFIVSVVISLLAGTLLWYSITTKGWAAVNPKSCIFLVFIVLFEFGKFQPGVAQWVTNILVLGIAVMTTWRGAERDNILMLNYGLLIMAVLILCRFFDTDMSFVVRGILFVFVGLSFFGANYWVLKKRKLQNV